MLPRRRVVAQAVGGRLNASCSLSPWGPHGGEGRGEGAPAYQKKARRRSPLTLAPPDQAGGRSTSPPRGEVKQGRAKACYGEIYREHSMATKSSQLEPWQDGLAGMAPVMSSRSTLRYESACVNSRPRQ